MQKKRFLSALWALTKPYWVSKERVRGVTLLVATVALALILVWNEVRFNTWNKDFYTTFETKDEAEFYRQIGVFTLLAVVYILSLSYKQYFQQMLFVEWRRWLTNHFLAGWMRDRAYYQIQLADQGTDNPDQRIAEDLNGFVDLTLTLTLGLLSSVVTLVSFVGILWSISGALTVAGFEIPGYLVWIALVYAIFGTFLAHWIGRPLIAINFDLQRKEADFRYSLVRLRENAEGVALYRGEAEELRGFGRRFLAVVGVWIAKIVKQKHLIWFQAFYAQLAIIFPLVVSAPRFFSGQAPLGYIFQVASAFGQVQTALSWFIDSYAFFANWKATVDRLTTFTEALERAREETRRTVDLRSEADTSAIELTGVNLRLPQGRPLLADTSLTLKKGESVLITGASGSGKSTLFRAIAGIWPYWKGRIALPKGARLLFLPQKPYLPIGSLKNAVCYPMDHAQVSDEAARDALSATGLAHLADTLEREENWAQLLSGGEQQRVALARALIVQPDWLFMDEPTAALPDDAQARLYALLKERLPNTTFVSIGHRAELERFHERKLSWESLA